MKDHQPAATLVAALIAVSAVAFAVPGAALGAESAPEGGSATYQCQGDYGTKPASTPVTFALVSPPDSARPGDTLSLSGNLGVALSDADVKASRALFGQDAKIDATDFNLVVHVGDETRNLKPSSVVSTAVPLKSPLVLSANVSYPDLTVPSDARGAVVIDMPAAKDTSTRIVGAPAKVTFTAHVAQTGLLPSQRNFACWTDDDPGPEARIARIPLATEGPHAAQAAGGATSGAASPGAASAGGASAPPADSQQGEAAPLSQAVPAVAEAVQGGPSADAAPVTRPATVGTSTKTSMASASIPAATRSGATFVAGWVLGLFLAVFPGAAVAGALLQRRRLRRLSAVAAASS